MRNVATLTKYILDKRYDIVAKQFSENEKKQLSYYVKNASEVWKSAMREMRESELATRVPFLLSEGPKVYALEPIAVADSLHMKIDYRSAPFRVYAIFYLGVHLLDDSIDDPHKFMSKFEYDKRLPLSPQINASYASIFLNVGISIHRILDADSKKRDAKEEVLMPLLNALYRYTHYLLQEKKPGLTPAQLLSIKQRNVAGDATSMISEVLQFDRYFGKRKAIHLKRALFYLGSLMSFTDDMRDYHVDKKLGTENLLLALERQNKKTAILRLAKLYKTEETLMFKEFKASGVKVNKEVIENIPWYPIILKAWDKRTSK